MESKFRSAAREALDRHLDEGKEDLSKSKGRSGQVGHYESRHYRFGDLVSEQRAATAYNFKLNEEFYQRQHQHAINGDPSGRVIHAVDSPPPRGRSATDFLRDRIDGPDLKPPEPQLNRRKDLGLER